MSDAVQKDIEHIDKHVSTLHHGVARSVAEMGQTTSTGEVNPNNVSSLHKIQEFIGHEAVIVGVAVGEAMEDVGYAAKVAYADLVGGHSKVDGAAVREANTSKIIDIQQRRQEQAANLAGKTASQISVVQSKTISSDSELSTQVVEEKKAA